MHLYTFLHRKRMYSHLYRGVRLCVLSLEGISFSNVNCILLALMHTWQVHACLYTLIHTVHTLLGAQQTTWGEADRTEWMLGSADCDKSQNFGKRVKSEDITLISEYFIRPTEEIWALILTMNSPGRKSSLESFGAATSFALFFGTPLLCQNRFLYQTLGRHE